MTSLNDLFAPILSTRFAPFVRQAFSTLNPGAEFVDGLYLRAMAHALERVERGETRRLIIALPPRHLKSLMGSIALPAWMLGRDPTRKVVCISYNSDLAQDFGRQSRLLMYQPWYRRVFPLTHVSQKKDSVSEFHTTLGGGGLRPGSGVL